MFTVQRDVLWKATDNQTTDNNSNHYKSYFIYKKINFNLKEETFNKYTSKSIYSTERVDQEDKNQTEAKFKDDWL